MAQYIKQEMPNMNGTEEPQVYYRLKTNVNYRADKTLVREANRRCKLERYGESRLRKSPYSKEERLQLALEFLENNRAMHVADYMQLTGLSRTTATMELKAEYPLLSAESSMYQSV